MSRVNMYCSSHDDLLFNLLKSFRLQVIQICLETWVKSDEEKNIPMSMNQ